MFLFFLFLQKTEFKSNDIPCFTIEFVFMANSATPSGVQWLQKPQGPTLLFKVNASDLLPEWVLLKLLCDQINSSNVPL